MNSRPVTAWLPILGLLAGLACAPSLAAAQPVALFAPEEGQIRALLIGIDAYRYVRPLKGAVSDAHDIEGALRRGGINDLTVRVDQQASRDAVIGAIEGLVQRTTRSDLVMIAIAGHGAQEQGRSGRSRTAWTPCSCSRISPPPRKLTPAHHRDEFNHFLKRFEDRGARVLFIADTCHGGGLTRDVDPRAGEMAPPGSLYRIPNDAHVPISTGSEAFLTELDFEDCVPRRGRSQDQGAGGSIPSVAIAARSAMRSRARWKAPPIPTATARSRSRSCSVTCDRSSPAVRPAAERRHAQFTHQYRS
jgi:hypothetical protein